MATSFPALRERNFRLFFVGNLISFACYWLQATAEAWWVKETTNSAFWVGLVAALPWMPAGFLSMFGGILVDRFGCRKILYCTNISGMIQSLVLAVLIFSGTCELWHVLVLTLLLGVINSVESPARNAFLTEIVSKDNLRSGGALCSTMINLSQVIGPALGALLIPIIGVGWTFVINAASFLASLLALRLMVLEQKKEYLAHAHPLVMINEGWRFVRSHNEIFWCIVLSGLVGGFGFSHRAALPIATGRFFDRGVEGLGVLNSALAFGSLLATFALSHFSRTVAPATFVIIGNILAGVALCTFGMSTNFTVGVIALLAAGFGFILSFVMLRTMIQGLCDRELIGRVMGIVVMAAYGGSAIGTTLVGIVGEQLGCRAVYIIWGMSLSALGVLLRYKQKSTGYEYSGS